ncbi:hypothetical protein ASO20_02070 [Mycoplasma sp. (ex Biomphalaria glabrata)]|uniref:tRNA (adenosine(37)-N6)-threonylcarbamoyltransferase complex ATPase subunit type 1 TsaE n=1 Tax=Mycoplasma sp. (ex Biomphalaria glabrata) TaxID=1749074 RepID=UPI00073A8FA5|nr:tRNA (adenosine(37)-N6)-threonylcarbamoyltransferase complex ATPase subunit type 1 TsaE [Mycoplasma sp. (ex Biomphalaria glabrata)]ALV23428.1 hypothetical protein ASO20_02070 [Mycoplasma sp. (ex Biomphalaria glabrata)]
MIKIASFSNYNEIDVKKLVKKLTKHFYNGLIIYFEGEVGSGKTFLIDKLINELDEKIHASSATFTIVETKKVNNYTLNHIDCYRLEDNSENKNLLMESLEVDLVFIEWASKLNFLQDIPHLLIKIQNNNNESRNYLIYTNDEKINQKFKDIQ